MSQPNKEHQTAATDDQRMKRALGLPGATMMGLGSILGTGVFVSIGIAAGITGPSVLLAVFVAALLAWCNAMSSAQLAASHPVSGGTYAYGYRYLSPSLGFTAGWMFLCAKSASAATAALGCAGYILHGLQIEADGFLVPLALAIVAALTLLVVAGVHRANWANTVIVSVTIIVLVLFVIVGLPVALERWQTNGQPWFTTTQPTQTTRHFLEAAALMFVAYTGYGRIATLGEEVRNPRRTIPRAILTTLGVSALLYMTVAFVAIGTLGSQTLAQATTDDAAPLEIAAAQFDWSAAAPIVAFGAITAMLGVLLNLILGLSRVLFAMGRQRDMPAVLGNLATTHATPVAAVIVVGLIIAGLTAIGSVRTTWSFSAFTVLIYYALTNAAALRLAPADRLYPRFFPWAGLIGCLGLAFWVQKEIWLVGLILITIGLIWHRIAQRRTT